MAEELRASIVIDYQNVHLTGHGLFASTRNLPRHETVIDPLLFAQKLLLTRNSRQRPGMAHAVLRRVLVYRGEPSSEHDAHGYARNQAQKSQWERDRRVQVTLRPLKYEYERDASGRPARDAAGHKIVIGRPQEKGVDVLCALAAVREAQDPATNLVVLASSDSDLAPACQWPSRSPRWWPTKSPHPLRLISSCSWVLLGWFGPRASGRTPRW